MLIVIIPLECIIDVSSMFSQIMIINSLHTYRFQLVQLVKSLMVV